jgi:predicted kinase
VTSAFDARPIIIAVAGPNGAGKSTFYRAHLEQAALRVVNADDLVLELGVDAYEAADLAQRLRQALVEQRESFIFETVLSDPAGEKVEFLRQAAATGYTVVLCFIGVDHPEVCEERLARRRRRRCWRAFPARSRTWPGPSASCPTSSSSTTATSPTPTARWPSSRRDIPSR